MRGVFTIATACLVAAAALSQARSAAIPAADDAVAPEMVWFVFTPECFQTLAVEHQLDVPCAKKVLAKTVGYGISLGKLAVSRALCAIPRPAQPCLASNLPPGTGPVVPASRPQVPPS